MATTTIYYIISAILSLLVLLGISMMSRVKTAVAGNFISAVSLLAGVIVTLWINNIISVTTIYIYIAIGALIGGAVAARVKMIEMPQLVALLNGIGGLASALVGILTLLHIGTAATEYITFTNITAVLAIVVGMVTLIGSLIAAGKLHNLLSQRPVIWKHHSLILNLTIVIMIAAVVWAAFIGKVCSPTTYITIILITAIAISSLFGYTFSIRVGGADMPITISLLNSLSGVAGAIAGMAIGDILLVSVGGIVGASGLFLTQIMCRSMNRSLIDILTAKTSLAGKPIAKTSAATVKDKTAAETSKVKGESVADIMQSAKSVIIVPGYGMALAQAQHLLRRLADRLEANGTEVKYAIHPVAGRMPGHMNVLLAEADVPYEQLYEMDAVNNQFKETDLVVVVGANDVLNPAARDAPDTPIYGMPILNVDEARHLIICNFDLKPGYAGVPNPLYEKTEGVTLLLGDAKESLTRLLSYLN